MKAKKAPAKKVITEKLHIHQLVLRIIAQARACFGSTGQGIFLARHIDSPAIVIIMVAALNTHIL